MEMDSNASSRILRASTSTTSTTSTFIATPATSRRGSTTSHHVNQPSPPLPTVPSGPLPVTTLSAQSWRTAYPRIGQFAMTATEEVVAAGPSGIFYFKRVRDHDSKPWSEARPLPNTLATLNDSSVSGLAVIEVRLSKRHLYVYCVSGGRLHSFYRSQEDGSSWVEDPRPPLSSYLISGTPAVAVTKDEYRSRQRWSLAVPCQSGGVLHTSTDGLSTSGPYVPRQDWEPVDHVAKNLGIISAVSITAIHTLKEYGYSTKDTDIVMACVASARLHTVEGKFAQESSGSYSRPLKWKAQASTRIHHPGEVTGNPVLVKKAEARQLDLLVPSAEGGVFHFVRTASTPDEWHMIARITFPQVLPAASCLAVNTHNQWQKQRQFHALVQSGGRLYQVRTFEGASPWSGSYLKPIVSPGPFSD
ncbi:hypothetical protein HD806DRAFT_536230 [Xylariaceae sp. AK1471]|nr:hypothetical protein HD806DRAFT_536230 [Xylariaceae sp. AK1471]